MGGVDERAHHGGTRSETELIRLGPIRFFGAAVHAAAGGRRNPGRTLQLTLVTLAAGAVAAVPPSATASGLEPEALTQARVIRAEVDAGYRHAPGRRLAVTEATPTGVVESITLITDWLEPWRVLPADDGIYFAICSVRATCPYPAQSAAWPAEAFLPRRMALELALRTLLETSVNLVVVALPTERPVWLVVERADLLTSVDAPAALDELASNPAVIDAPLRELVGRLALPRLFVPVPILPAPDDTIYAVRLSLTNSPPRSARLRVQIETFLGHENERLTPSMRSRQGRENEKVDQPARGCHRAYGCRRCACDGAVGHPDR